MPPLLDSRRHTPRRPCRRWQPQECQTVPHYYCYHQPRPGAGTVLSSSHHDFRSFSAAAPQLLVPFAADHGGAVPFVGDAKVCGSFTSLLSTQGSGLLALGGFGLGIGSGLEDVGFGLGRAVWPFQGVVENGAMSVNAGGSTMAGHTWQLENENGGFVGGGLFRFARSCYFHTRKFYEMKSCNVFGFVFVRSGD
ncbi:UNVERIFIED_CONTAM: hypothetical protein Sangu_1248700 [Sesamum angustifolium]|uniref:Uncharacterized protein n=1 Tax=Sesamum angustifolium TaxID=2727405 RepID=A0AAW2NKZ1_9LAMI